MVVSNDLHGRSKQSFDVHIHLGQRAFSRDSQERDGIHGKLPPSMCGDRFGVLEEHVRSQEASPTHVSCAAMDLRINTFFLLQTFKMHNHRLD